MRAAPGHSGSRITLVSRLELTTLLLLGQHHPRTQTQPLSLALWSALLMLTPPKAPAPSNKLSHEHQNDTPQRRREVTTGLLDLAEDHTSPAKQGGNHKPYLSTSERKMEEKV
eukprot:Skav233788  [mRNA]  locus=scaffold780:297879:309209:- [translate_table: standard]